MGKAHSVSLICALRAMVLDTNILIAYLDGEEAVVDFVLRHKEVSGVFFISSVTITELLSLATLSTVEIKRMTNFLENFVSIPFDDQIAITAAAFRRQYTLSVPDAALVATASICQVPLITRDRAIHKVVEITFVDL